MAGGVRQGSSGAKATLLVSGAASGPAGAEAIDVTPSTIRPALLAAFTRARRLGLGIEDVEKALGGAAGARAGSAAVDPKVAAVAVTGGVAKKSR